MRNALSLILLSLLSPAISADADRAAIEKAVSAPERSSEDRTRDATEKPVEVLAFFGVRPGMQVADIMSAGGYYTEILSRVVGAGGEVIAQNNQPYLDYAKESAEKRYAAGTLKNVRRLNTELEDMGLGDGTLDFALFVKCWHDAYWINEKEWPRVDTDKFMANLLAALKPDGVVGVVDHVAPVGTPVAAIDALHRIDPEFIKAEFKRAGFVFDGESDLLRNPADDYTKSVFDESVKGKTDRVVYKFRKP